MLLPDDIALKHMKTARERFHSRFDAVEKMYRYRIRTSTEKMCLNDASCGSMESLLM